MPSSFYSTIMKNILFVFVVLLGFEHLQAQGLGGARQQDAAGISNVFHTQIPLAEPKLIGSSYLSEEWQSAEIFLKTGEKIEGYPVKVEIEHANVEIQYKGEIKFLNLEAIDFIRCFDSNTGKYSIVKSAKQFNQNDTPLTGIVEVINDGSRYSVVKHFYIEIRMANYNVALDVGSKDHQKLKKEKLYLAQGTKLLAVKGNKNKLTEQLGDDSERAQKIIKSHKLNLSKESDLVTLVKLLQS